MRSGKALLIPVLLGLSCFDFDLLVTKDGAALRSGASHESRKTAELPRGAILKSLRKSGHFYQAEYKDEKGRLLRGWVYRDDIRRHHKIGDIYSRTYRSEDNLALMITWPAIIILLGVWIASSGRKWLNWILVALLVFIIMVQSVYVLAMDTADHHRKNAGFRIMIDGIQNIRRKNPEMFIFFTDYTWPARIEVLTGFGMNFDRFSKDREYNGRARMRYLDVSTPSARLRGSWVITDPYYYDQVRSAGWELPASFYQQSYPSNWSLVRKVGSARLFFVR